MGIFVDLSFVGKGKFEFHKQIPNFLTEPFLDEMKNEYLIWCWWVFLASIKHSGQ